MKCNGDCFHCKYVDCIADENWILKLDAEDIENGELCKTIHEENDKELPYHRQLFLADVRKYLAFLDSAEFKEYAKANGYRRSGNSVVKKRETTEKTRQQKREWARRKYEKLKAERTLMQCQS